jgi:hypothetical protein
MAPMKPTVGRVVHYQSYGTPGGEFLPEPRAAVVSEVNSDPNPGELVGLVVLNPTGLFFNLDWDVLHVFKKAVAAAITEMRLRL